MNILIPLCPISVHFFWDVLFPYSLHSSSVMGIPTLSRNFFSKGVPTLRLERPLPYWYQVTYRLFNDTTIWVSRTTLDDKSWTVLRREIPRSISIRVSRLSIHPSPTMTGDPRRLSVQDVIGPWSSTGSKFSTRDPFGVVTSSVFDNSVNLTFSTAVSSTVRSCGLGPSF